MAHLCLQIEQKCAFLPVAVLFSFFVVRRRLLSTHVALLRPGPQLHVGVSIQLDDLLLGASLLRKRDHPLLRQHWHLLLDGPAHWCHLTADRLSAVLPLGLFSAASLDQLERGAFG